MCLAAVLTTARLCPGRLGCVEDPPAPIAAPAARKDRWPLFLYFPFSNKVTSIVPKLIFHLFYSAQGYPLDIPTIFLGYSNDIPTIAEGCLVKLLNVNLVNHRGSPSNQVRHHLRNPSVTLNATSAISSAKAPRILHAPRLISLYFPPSSLLHPCFILA